MRSWPLTFFAHPTIVAGAAESAPVAYATPADVAINATMTGIARLRTFFTTDPA
jgi:hypothetical protein